MVDRPGRERGARFPADISDEVKTAILARVKELKPCIGYCSAACGSDLLFAEAMIQENQQIHITLPFSKDEFRDVSVRHYSTVTNLTADEPNWVDRFDAVMKSPTRTIVTGEHVPDCEAVSFHYANLVQTGLAALHARKLGTKIVPLAVWNREDGDGPGGTADIMQHWKGMGLKPQIIDINEIRIAQEKLGKQRSGKKGKTNVAVASTAPDQETAASEPPPQLRIRAMLFADVKNYSKLKEHQIPEFVRIVMGRAAELAAKDHSPETQNTWGDALYLVFKTVRDAGLFALDLRDQLCGGNKLTKGRNLPDDLTFRIALHAGPVYELHDPILKGKNFSGKHVNRAGAH